MRLTIRNKILLAGVATLLLVGWFFIYLLRAQKSIERVVVEILERHLTALHGAQKIENRLLHYDTLVFRYLSTEDRDILNEMREVRRGSEVWIARMVTAVEGQTEQDLLAEVRDEIGRYHAEIDRMLKAHEARSKPRRRRLFDLLRAKSAETLSEEDKVDLQLVSALGKVRLQQISARCDKLVDISRVKMEAAEKLMRNKVHIIRLTVFAVGGLILACVAGIMMVLAVALLAPLRSLLQGIQKVTEGELNLELPVTGQDEIGRLTQLFNSMIRNLREKQDRLTQETVTDAVTELYNLRYFKARLKNEIARSARYHHTFSLLMIDIDHFKNYNDKNGHEMGNVVLKQVGAILRDNVRGDGIVARYGGEEFGVILPETDGQNGRKVAERIRASVEQSLFPGQQYQPGKKLTVSAGGACFPSGGGLPTQLIERADRALYQAKAAGRNRVVWLD